MTQKSAQGDWQRTCEGHKYPARGYTRVTDEEEEEEEEEE
jgi:hypothetical protein